MLTTKEKNALVRTAFSAIEGRLADAPGTMTELRGSLARTSGMFVSLRLDNDLRGCVGYVESDRPVGEVVADLAVKASFEDPRFRPLTIEEYPEIVVEISLLSPLRELQPDGLLEIGTHGLVVESGSHRGVLLPHTATEKGWDREIFMLAVLKKAGLPPDALNRPDTRFLTFTTEIVRSEEVVSE